MRRSIVVLALCVGLFLAPGPALAVQMDASNAGSEFIGPQTMIVHNMLVGSTYYAVTFQWFPLLNLWYPAGYELEDPTFSAAEHYPLNQGDTWTYETSEGIPLTLTVYGTADVCGETCIVLEASDGSTTYWISDDTGIFMAQYSFPNGFINRWCPPMKIPPAQMYLGSQTLTPLFDIFIGLADGTQYGSLDGWSSFVVKAVEDVIVPAGTFIDCFRATFVFSHTDTWSGNVGMRIEETWYAQGVGIVKRVNTETYCNSDCSALTTTSKSYLLESYSVNN